VTPETSRPPLPEPAFREVDGTDYELLETVRVPDERHACVLTIPAGRVTDFASSPRAAWLLFDRLDGGTLPPAVHDELYRHGGVVDVAPARAYTRAEADRLFYDLMLRQGVAPWRARLAYLGVRVGGASAWRASASFGTPLGTPFGTPALSPAEDPR